MIPKPLDNPAAQPSAASTDSPVAAVPILSYATPIGFEPGVWHSGKYVVVSHEADLPLRCVKCNGNSDDQTICNIGQWRGPLHLGLCSTHAASWQRWRTFGIIWATLGILAVIVSVGELTDAMQQPHTTVDWADLFGPVLCAAFFFGPALFIDRFFKPLGRMKREGNTLWLWRSGRAFRNSLREFGDDSDDT